MMTKKPDCQKNPYGIEVKVCCASCQHKDNTRLINSRWCKKRARAVAADNVCSLWAMSFGMRHAGGSQGSVRDKDTKEIIIH
jgi:hypothetical protein